MAYVSAGVGSVCGGMYRGFSDTIGVPEVTKDFEFRGRHRVIFRECHLHFVDALLASSVS